ncbi:MAG: YraN family protein [Pseudomonadota bacterium]
MKTQAARQRTEKETLAGRRTDAFRADAWGRSAEEAVVDVYQRRGARLKEQRVRRGRGEIDLVFECAGTMVFVEVKARKNLRDALHAITAQKWRRLQSAALGYIADHPEIADMDCRFDLAAVSAAGEIEIVENIQGPDET